MLKSVNLSGKSLLDTLDVSQNEALTELKTDGCNAVEYFSIGQCSGLTGIDVSGMSGLKWLVVYNSGLTTLDITKNPELEYLTAYGTGISELDLSNNAEVTELYLSDGMESLDVSFCPKLRNLSVSGANITSLDFSNNTQLESLDLIGCGFTTVDHSMCPNLQSVKYDSNNNLTTIDMSKNLKLNHVSAMQCDNLTTVYMTEDQYIASIWGFGQDIVIYKPLTVWSISRR